jgi:hypothetical protein
MSNTDPPPKTKIGEIRSAVRFFFWEGDPCCSWFFVLGGGSVLLMAFSFWDWAPCCSSFFVLGGGKNDEQHGSPSQKKKRTAVRILSQIKKTWGTQTPPPKRNIHDQHEGRGIRVAHHFFSEVYPCCSSLFVLGGGSVLLIVFLFWEGDKKSDEQHGSPFQNKKWYATRIPL